MASFASSATMDGARKPPGPASPLAPTENNQVKLIFFKVKLKFLSVLCPQIPSVLNSFVCQQLVEGAASRHSWVSLHSPTINLFILVTHF